MELEVLNAYAKLKDDLRKAKEGAEKLVKENVELCLAMKELASREDMLNYLDLSYDNSSVYYNSVDSRKEAMADWLTGRVKSLQTVFKSEEEKDDA